MKYRVNIVEDEENLNSILKLYLEKEGYIVKSFLDGNTALEGIENPPDLWVLDIMLPDINGYTLFKKIKESVNDSAVIFISAKSQDLDRVIGLEMGGDDYIAKPFLPRELVLKVNKLLKLKFGANDGQKEGRLRIGAYTICKDRYKVFENDRELEFTVKEFRLLAMLAESRETVFSREQILERIWGENYYGSDRVVDDTIRRIRKKVPELQIETVYGFGYQLVDNEK
ncbi:MAG TPA: response regulator transcription factor [Negativicutes bacterium]|nr:response regulator transcription factor [Negativicutes bacterium]